MIGISPAELMLMQSDFVDLLNGCDANTITMTWQSGTPDPVYPGKWIGQPTNNTQQVQGIVVFGAAYRIEGGHVHSSLAKTKFAEMPEADIAIIAPASINMKGLVNLVFQIAGLGNYKPLEKPGEDLSQHAILFPAGQAMVQWVFCKAQK